MVNNRVGHLCRPPRTVAPLAKGRMSSPAMKTVLDDDETQPGKFGDEARANFYMRLASTVRLHVSPIHNAIHIAWMRRKRYVHSEITMCSAGARENIGIAHHSMQDVAC